MFVLVSVPNINAIRLVVIRTDGVQDSTLAEVRNGVAVVNLNLRVDDIASLQAVTLVAGDFISIK